MKKNKKITSLIIGVALLFTPFPVQASNVFVTVDGLPVTFEDVQPAS